MNIEDSGNFLFCHDHSNEKASIFCDTCKIVACHLCVCVGHGAHCSHTIIDLDTAKKQLQETVEFAQEKLSALLTSFSERETDMDTHLQNSKTLEENAQNAIISQYNCIMSDITDSLNIAKKKSLDAIAALGSSHSTHLSSGSRHIKALLSHCEDLNEACKGFLEMEDDGSFSSDSQSANSSFSSSVGNCKEQNIQFSKHQKSSMVSSRHLSEGSALAKMHSRNVKKTPNRHSSDGSSLSCSPICDGNRHPPHFLAPARRPSHSEVKLSEVHSNSFGFDAPVTESKSSQNFEPSAEDGSTVSRKSASINMKGKASSAILELDATDNSEATKESNSGKSHSDLNKPSNLRQNCKSLIQSKSCTQSQITGKKHPSLNGKDESSNYGRCMPETNFPHQNLSTPQSESQVSAAELTKKSLIPGRREDVPNQKEEDIVYSEGQDMVQFGSNFKRKNQLLLRADEVGPVLEQVSALSKQVEQERSNRKKSLDAKIKDFNQNIDLSVSSFHSSTLHLINNMTAHITAECPVIIPSVRSISVSSPHQELSTPRVQSRVLMTWGFNSTTFIADPISSSAQWTVNIIRNTSHIGDVKSGYLFGVGIALNTLNSKDQVGMSSNSHAIVCINGDLAVCHDKQLSPIMPLSDLPMSVTISVNQNLGKYLYMTYKIRVNGLSKCLQGRRVVSLPPDSQKNPKPAASIAADTKDKDHQKYAGSVTFSTPVGNHESDTAGSDQESKLISQVEQDKSLSQDEPSLCLFSIFPVFTVSQRVKMQFPQTSEV